MKTIHLRSQLPEHIKSVDRQLDVIAAASDFTAHEKQRLCSALQDYMKALESINQNT